METYRAGIISGKHSTELKTLELTRPEGKQVLVKVDSCAVCTLEQRIFSGEMPFYPFAGGHEMSGTVVETGPEVRNISAGDKAALRMYTACGECLSCRSGHHNQCERAYKTSVQQGFPGPGGFSEYMTVDAQHVYRLPDHVNLEHAALAEPLSCCIHSVSKADIRFGETVVIIGAGIMGLLHLKLALLRGARTVVCDIDPERIEKARLSGAYATVNPEEEDAEEKISLISEGGGADVVFCTAAPPSAAELAVGLAGKFGRVIFYSSVHPDEPVPLNANRVHSEETLITGSVNPEMRDFLSAVRLISADLINLSGLVSGIVPLERLPEALETALNPSNYRVLVKCTV